MNRALTARLSEIVGDSHVVTNAGDMATHLGDWRGRYRGQARCVVRPGDVDQVAATISLCREEGIPIVPQGGNTGVCGGAIPDSSGRSVVLSLSRLNRVRAIDSINNTMTVDAGCILADIHRRAEEVDRIFPLDLGSDGTCQIGGNLSTNAGGTAVLRYGNMRELVLGLEVVLSDGRIWDGLRGLRKDNSGYDLKQIFIGAEGTLGVITGAVLKLFQKPASIATAFVAVASPAAALAVLARLRRTCSDGLTAFELISEAQLTAVLQHIPGTRRPTSGASPWYIVIEAALLASDGEAQRLFEAVIEAALTFGELSDAVVAKSQVDAKQFWRLRHSVSEANVKTGRVVSHDTSVPVSSIPVFIERCDLALRARFASASLHYVGHVGDGNVHVVAIFPRETTDDASFATAAKVANSIVHGTALSLNGSIAAEHGVGQSLRDELVNAKSPIELELMRRLKFMLDPLNLLNPGKVVS